MGKCPFGEVSITDVSSRGIVQSGISPSGRCLSGNVSWGSVLGEVLVGELSSRETVLQSSNRTSIKIMVMTVITVSWKEEGSEYCQKIRYWCLRHVTNPKLLGIFSGVGLPLYTMCSRFFFLAVVKFNFLTRKFYSRRRRFQIVKMEISNFSANINLVVVVEKVIKIILLRMPSGNHNMLIKRCEPMDIFIVAIDFNSFF